MSSTAVPSLTEAVTPVAADAHVAGIAWLRDTAAFAAADGGVLLAKDGATHCTQAHPDAGILVAAGDGERLLTGGDDPAVRQAVGRGHLRRRLRGGARGGRQQRRDGERRHLQRTHTAPPWTGFSPPTLNTRYRFVPSAG